MSQSQKPHADFDFAWVVRFLGVEHRLLTDDEEQAIGPVRFLKERINEMRARFAEQFSHGDVVDMTARVDVPEAAFEDFSKRKGRKLQRTAAFAHARHRLSSVAADAAKSGWVMNPTW